MSGRHSSSARNRVGPRRTGMGNPRRTGNTGELLPEPHPRANRRRAKAAPPLAFPVRPRPVPGAGAAGRIAAFPAAAGTDLSQTPTPTPPTYRDAGVDIDAGNEVVERIKPLVRRSFRPEVMGGLGGFGALFDLSGKYREPVLVSGTDGVGTKLKLAQQLGRHDTIGIDLVAMC